MVVIVLKSFAFLKSSPKSVPAERQRQKIYRILVLAAAGRLRLESKTCVVVVVVVVVNGHFSGAIYFKI